MAHIRKNDWKYLLLSEISFDFNSEKLSMFPSFNLPLLIEIRCRAVISNIQVFDLERQTISEMCENQNCGSE